MTITPVSRKSKLDVGKVLKRQTESPIQGAPCTSMLYSDYTDHQVTTFEDGRALYLTGQLEATLVEYLGYLSY